MPIDFTSTPLPANGNARSASGLAAAFNNIKAVYNAHVNNTTPADQHDSQAILGHGVLPLTTARTTAAQTQYVTNDMFAKAILDIVGTANFTDAIPGTITNILNAINLHTIIAAPPTSIDWSAVTNTNTVDVNKFNQNFKIVPGGSPLRTVVKAAFGYNAAAGVAHWPADQTVTHPSSTVGMTAGQSRYDAISLDGTALVVLTPGTGASSPTPPGTPVGQKVLGYVLIPYNTDATLIPASNIIDVRGNSVVEGGGGGGTGSTINHPYGSFGTGTDTSTPSVDTPTVLEGGYLGTSTTVNGINLGNIYVHTDMSKDVATDASLGDMAENVGAQNIMALIRNGVAGATVTIGADVNNPVPIAIQGRRRKITAPISATASGGAGVRYVIASCATAGVGTWSLIVSPSPAVAAFQQVLAVIWWDSATLQAGTAIDFSQLFSAPSTSLLLEGANAVGTIPAAGYPTITGSSAWQAIAGMPSTLFYLPKPATADVRLVASWAVPSASSSNQFRAVIDATPEGLPIFVSPTASGGNATGCVCYRRASKIPAGIHSLTIQAFVTTGQTLGILSDLCSVYLDFSY